MRLTQHSPPQGGGVIWNRTQTLALGETGRPSYEIIVELSYFLIIIIVETPGAWYTSVLQAKRLFMSFTSIWRSKTDEYQIGSFCHRSPGASLSDLCAEPLAYIKWPFVFCTLPNAR